MEGLWGRDSRVGPPFPLTGALFSCRVAGRVPLLSGPVLRDTARLSQRYPLLRAAGSLVSQHGQLDAIPVGVDLCERVLPRNAPDTFNFLRHVMRAIWSVRPKCSHKCVSLKETPLKPV